jgi:hypothetical protein
LAVCWKWFGSKNSSLLEVCKGVAAELAACWKVHKGVMAELAPRFSGRNLGNGYALFGMGLAAIIFWGVFATTLPTPGPGSKR